MALVSQLSPTELAAGSEAVAQEILARDPALAAQLFAGSQDGNDRSLLLGLAKAGFSPIFANLEQIRDPAFREEMLIAACSGSSFNSRDKFLTNAAIPMLRNTLAAITDSHSQLTVTQKLCALAASDNPAFATELWSGMTTAEQLQGSTLIAFFQKMGTSDPAGARAVYAASPPEVQAVGLRILSYSLAGSDPQSGLKLVLQQSDPKVQAESAATLLAFWAEKDPAQAIAALEAHAAELDLPLVAQGMSNAGLFQSPGMTYSYSLNPNQILRQKLQSLIQASGASEGGSRQ